MDRCLDIICKVSGNNSVGNLKSEARVASSCCYSLLWNTQGLSSRHIPCCDKQLYRPACNTFHPVCPGMVLLWEGCYKQTCKCQSGLKRYFQSHFRRQIPRDTPTCVLQRADVADLLFCSFDLLAGSFELLDVTFWPELVLNTWASPAIGKGMKKECSGGSKPIYKCAALVMCRIHCANSFLCVKLLFRASGRFLSLATVSYTC